MLIYSKFSIYYISLNYKKPLSTHLHEYLGVQLTHLLTILKVSYILLNLYHKA